MEDQNYINEIQSELRKKFKERDSAIQHLRRIQSSISKLSSEKNSQQGLPPIRMTDEELAYAIKLVIKELIPASKAFLLCATMFKKDDSWSKRVVRYRPITGQLRRVLNTLEKECNYEFLLIKKYGLLDAVELESSNTLRALMGNLKRVFKLARALNQRDVQIKTLQEQAINKDRYVKSLQLTLSQSLFLSQSERVIEINRLFPLKTYSEIAKATKISRQSVSNYIKTSLSSSS